VWSPYGRVVSCAVVTPGVQSLADLLDGGGLALDGDIAPHRARQQRERAGDVVRQAKVRVPASEHFHGSPERYIAGPPVRCCRPGRVGDGHRFGEPHRIAEHLADQGAMGVAVTAGRRRGRSGRKRSNSACDGRWAAAAHLAERGINFVIVEVGERAGAAITAFL
jgi:hypothetical protein